jgi:hypothetical protein
VGIDLCDLGVGNMSEPALSRWKLGWIFGVGLVGLHVVGLLLFAKSCQTPALSVTMARSASASGSAAEVLAATVPPGLRDITQESWDPSSIDQNGQLLPGLARKRWSISRRGGQTESVAATQLVGPFLDPQKPVCSGRVIVGQSMLQNNQKPGTVAALLAKVVDDNLRGLSIVGAGDFARIENVRLQWAQLSKHAEDKAMLAADVKAAVGAKDLGYLRISLQIYFDRVTVPVVLAVLPAVVPGQVAITVRSKATLDFGNRALQWVSDKLGGDKVATRFAKKEINAAVLPALSPPPPVALPGGGSLTFGFCDQQLEIIDNAYAALPVSVSITAVQSGDQKVAILPPEMPAMPWPTPTGSEPLMLQLDLNGLNSILFESWRHGFLDRTLAEAELDKKFNEDPLVQEYLTVRISPLRLALPPVLFVHKGAVRVGVETVLNISDPPQAMLGHAWSLLSVDVATQLTSTLPAVSLEELALTCEQNIGTLTSCYPLLSQAVAARSADFNQTLSSALSTVLHELFEGSQFAVEGAPAVLKLGAMKVSGIVSERNAIFQLSLDSQVLPQ